MIRTRFLLAAPLVLAACVGTIGSNDRNGKSGDVTGNSIGPDGEVRCVTPAIGPSPLRRITRAEYDNSVRDLLGDTTQPAKHFAVDTEAGLFDNVAKQQTV